MDVEEEKKKIDENGGILPGKTWPQYLAAVLATMCTFCAGASMGWTSPALPYLQQTLSKDDDMYNAKSNVSVVNETGISDSEASWIGSLLPLGALVGSLPAGHVANMIGRKRLLLLLSLFYVVGWTLIIAAGRSAKLIFIARFISGIAIGVGSVITPIYSEEIAEVSVRGALGVFYDMQMNHGILWTYMIGAYLPYLWFCIANAIIPAVFFLTFLWMPESPMYLASKGRIKEAQKSLKWLRGAKYIKNYDVKPELERIQMFVSSSAKEEDSSETVSKNVMSVIILKLKAIQKILFSPSELATRKSIKIVTCLMILRQLSGINDVIFYTVYIFEDAGISLSPFLATIIIGVIQVLTSYVSCVSVDRVGRRLLLLISDATMAICHLGLTVYFYVKQNHNDTESIQWLPVVCLTIFVFVFNIGFGCIPWVMMAELVPNESKSWASGLGASTSWILVFLITNSFENMVEHVGLVITFGIFCVICSLGTVFVAFIVPETKGKNREEIQRMLVTEENKKSWRDLGIYFPFK